MDLNLNLHFNSFLGLKSFYEPLNNYIMQKRNFTKKNLSFDFGPRIILLFSVLFCANCVQLSNKMPVNDFNLSVLLHSYFFPFPPLLPPPKKKIPLAEKHYYIKLI